MKSIPMIFIAIATVIFSCSDDETYQVIRCTESKYSQKCPNGNNMYESSGEFQIPCGQILQSINSDGAFNEEMHCCYKITIKKDEDACCNWKTCPNY